jgi:hypothetical protein
LIVEEIEQVRNALLAAYDEKAVGTIQKPTTAPKQVRNGMYKARQIIVSEPPGPSLIAWLEAVLARMEQERTVLREDPYDEDGWTLGGLRTIQNLVEERLEDLKRPPSAPLRFAQWLRKKMTGGS